MRFDDLVGSFGDQPYFDLASLSLMSGQPRPQLLNQLSRWKRAGKLIALRRGLYTLAPGYRRCRLEPAHLANHLHSPSYLSLQWALQFHGLIPDAVATFTSVTTRGPRTFSNALGRFTYQNIKQPAFVGYHTETVVGQRLRIAVREKALLDLLHLGPGEWTAARLRELRLQNLEELDRGRLQELLRAFDSPRLDRAGARLDEILADGETR